MENYGKPSKTHHLLPFRRHFRRAIPSRSPLRSAPATSSASAPCGSAVDADIRFGATWRTLAQPAWPMGDLVSQKLFDFFDYHINILMFI